MREKKKKQIQKKFKLEKKSRIRERKNKRKEYRKNRLVFIKVLKIVYSFDSNFKS